MSNLKSNRRVKIRLPKLNLTTTEKHLSLTQLIIFGLFFAGIGGYFVYKSFAAGPITITAGGTYTGDWVSSGSTPAVKIATSQPVIIQNSKITNSGTGYLIDANYAGADVTVINSTFNGGTGQALYSANFKKIHVEQSTINKTWGIRLDNGQSGAKVLITRNIFNNQIYDGINPFWLSHSFQIVNTLNPASVDVSWNQFIGEFGQSQTEDVINIYSSAYVKVHDNYVEGAYPNALGDAYTGGGIIVDGPNGHHNEFYNNIVVDTMNYSLAIAGGRDNKVYNNRAVNDSKNDAGQTFTGQSSGGIGLYVADFSNTGSGFTGNQMYSNTVGVLNSSGSRSDWWLPSCQIQCSNSAISGPITRTTEQAEWTLWQQKLASNGITIGASTSTPPPSPPPTISLTANPTSISAGNSSTLTWTSTNATSCTASGAWSGTKATSGTQSVLPTSTSIYNLSCTGTGGTANASATVTVNTVPPPDTTPPTVSITAPSSGATVSGTVTISASASDNVGVSKVEFYIDGSLKTTDTSSPYSYNWDTTTYTNGTHSIIAKAYDAAGNSSSAQISVTVSNGDLTPPSAPTNLTATASAYNKVDLSWSASTDNVGVTGYYIVRNGVTIASTSGTVTTYSDTTVSPSTTYSYYVIARDAAGNASGPSNTASVTTPPAPDTTPPSAPTNLTATAVSSSQINLSWSASTDNVGVTGYDIYQNGIRIATVSTTSYGRTGLSPSTTYSYYVIARDAAGNSSPASNTASATTQPLAATAGNLAGVISSSSGGNLPGRATISLVVNGSTRTYKADRNGSYYISSLPAATYNVTYSAKFHASTTRSATITSGTTTIINVVLQRL